MAAIFISSCYQAAFRFAIEQTGNVRSSPFNISRSGAKGTLDLRVREQEPPRRMKAIAGRKMLSGAAGMPSVHAGRQFMASTG
jgi:hypothetical protein